MELQCLFCFYNNEEAVSIVPIYIFAEIKHLIKQSNLKEKYVFCRTRAHQQMCDRIASASDPVDSKFVLMLVHGREFVRGVERLCMPLGKSYIIKSDKKALRLQATLETFKELVENDTVMNL